MIAMMKLLKSLILSAFYALYLSTHFFAAEVSPGAFSGLWVQIDSGAVLEFRTDGTINGQPLQGTFRAPTADTIAIISSGETLELKYKVVSKDLIEITRQINGKDDKTALRRLIPTTLKINEWGGRYLIQHLVAKDKVAQTRPVILHSTGHFRTLEGGFYFRVTEAPNGGIYGYASGEGDETLNVQAFTAADYLVFFDRLDRPRLFAACLRVDELFKK
jgi:hypothetical protein